MADKLPGTTGDSQLDNILASVNSGSATTPTDSIDKLVARSAAPPDMAQRKKDEDAVLSANAGATKEVDKERQSLADFVKANPYPQPNVKPWTQQPPQPNPMKAFGSWASALGILAGALTKTPLMSSLNASAAAMSAIRKNDLDTYDKAYKVWQDNTELAIRQTEWAAKSYANALDVMKTDQTLGMQKWTLAATLAQDRAAMHLTDVQTMQQYTDHLLNTVDKGYDIRDKVKAHADELSQTTSVMQSFFTDHPEYGINPKDPQLAQKAAAWAQQNPKGAVELRDAFAAQKGHEKALESGKDKTQEFIAERRTEYEALHGPGSYTTDMELRDTREYTTSLGKGTSTAKEVDLSDISDPTLRKQLETFKGNATKLAELKGGYYAFMDQHPGGKPTYADVAATARILSKGTTVSQTDAAEIQRQLSDPNNKLSYEEVRQKVTNKGLGTLDDATAKFIAGEIVAGDQNAGSGYGRSPADKEKIAKWTMNLAAQQGLTSADLAARSANYAGMQAGQRSVAQRFVMVSAAAHELSDNGGFLDQAWKQSLAYDQTNFPEINEAIQAYSENTGNPNIRTFGAAVQAITNSYAQLLTRSGATTDAARLTAHNLIMTRDSPEAFRALLGQIGLEATTVLKAPAQVSEDLDAMVSNPAADASTENSGVVHLGVSDPQAVFNAMPNGTKYVGPDGAIRVKP